jgi:hypothetical protein
MLKKKIIMQGNALAVIEQTPFDKDNMDLFFGFALCSAKDCCFLGNHNERLEPFLVKGSMDATVLNS